jgi:hypothetical protein
MRYGEVHPIEDKIDDFDPPESCQPHCIPYDMDNDGVIEPGEELCGEVCGDGDLELGYGHQQATIIEFVIQGGHKFTPLTAVLGANGGFNQGPGTPGTGGAGHFSANRDGPAIDDFIDVGTLDWREEPGQNIALIFPPTFAEIDRLAWEVTGGGMSIDDLTYTVQITNQPPIASAGGPYSALQTGPGPWAPGTVTLDGTGSSDPDGDPLTFLWTAPITIPPVTFDDPTSITPIATFPVGVTAVTLTVTDPSGESHADVATVTIISRTEAIQSIIDDVQALVDAEPPVLGRDAQGLIRKLEQAINRLHWVLLPGEPFTPGNPYNPRAAIRLLQAFIVQVRDFIQEGKLTAAQGQPLIDAAQEIIDSLGG